MDFSVSISVIMPTYNTETEILKEAVESILDQTFSDFEFLIIDDGTTNGSDKYLESIQDERVRIIQNSSNVGITKSLNVGLKQAKGKYIARMDADDISARDRFKKEFTYMELHPDVIVCGSQEGEIINGEIVTNRSLKKIKPEKMKDYRVRMLFMNPGPRHPTAMIRHEQLILHHILYDERLIYAQDYGMWEMTSHFGKICVLDEVLLYRRKHENQITIARRDVQIKCDKMTQRKLLSDLLGSVTDEELDMHYTYSIDSFPEIVISPEIVEWYDRLIQANKFRHIYDENALEKRIIIIKKKLIRQTIKSDMSIFEIIQLIFHYLPFWSGVRMMMGSIKRIIRQ